MSVTQEVTPEDLIFYKEGNKIYSGGFQVNSILLKQGLPALQQAGNRDSSKTEKVSDLFADFAVPSGLLYLPNNNLFSCTKINEKEDLETNSEDYLSEDIYDTLMNLASVKKTGTKKRKVRKGGTRKNRKG